MTDEERPPARRSASGADDGAPPDDPPPDADRDSISRRELLKGAGLAGAAAFLPRVDGLAAKRGQEETKADGGGPTDRESGSSRQIPGPPGAPLHNLTAREAEILDAVIGRLIPADEHGPGAREAGALRYIDRALGGALSDSREAYRTGLSALDRYARYSRGAPFVELSPTDQDSVLFDVQGGGATGAGVGFDGSSASFFYMIRSHTLQGTFGDPSYGGNADFVGWELIGYPGPRLGVSPETQRRLEAGELDPNHRSAYEFGPFSVTDGSTE